MTVKTEISVRKDLFQEALTLAQTLEISYSQLFTKALEDFVQKYRQGNSVLDLSNNIPDLDSEEQIWLEARSLKLDERFPEDDESW